jgi:hypothetical protein
MMVWTRIAGEWIDQESFAIGIRGERWGDYRIRKQHLGLGVSVGLQCGGEDRSRYESMQPSDELSCFVHLRSYLFRLGFGGGDFPHQNF